MIFLVLMARVLQSINIHLEPSGLAVAAAVNAALVIPDIFLWKSVYASIGSKFLHGGKYLRPFIAGVVPWALSVPFIYGFTFYFVHFLSVLVIVSK
jgi:hypothetical protein